MPFYFFLNKYDLSF